MNLNMLLLDAAQSAATTTAAAATGEAMPLSSQIIYYGVQLLPMVLIFVVFWFFLIRPQRKKDKEAADMLKALKVGDRICTIGGFYGTIVRIKDEVLTVSMGAGKTEMQIARWAVKNIDTSEAVNETESLV